MQQNTKTAPFCRFQARLPCFPPGCEADTAGSQAVHTRYPVFAPVYGERGQHHHIAAADGARQY